MKLVKHVSYLMQFMMYVLIHTLIVQTRSHCFDQRKKDQAISIIKFATMARVANHMGLNIRTVSSHVALPQQPRQRTLLRSYIYNVPSVVGLCRTRLLGYKCLVARVHGHLGP